MNHEVKIRTIQPGDDAALATIIRAALLEFKANKPGTVYYDQTTDHLFAIFTKKRSAYFVITINEIIYGGGGIYPTNGLPNDTCELVKMYLAPTARGQGIGKMLMNACINEARANGYNQIYLETMPELVDAIPMYQKFGFRFITESMGQSGHDGCDVFMIKEI